MCVIQSSISSTFFHFYVGCDSRQNFRSAGDKNTLDGSNTRLKNLKCSCGDTSCRLHARFYSVLENTIY